MFAKRVRVCRLRGWDAVLFGAVGLRWSWVCSSPLCPSWLFGTSYRRGYAMSWESAYRMAEQHVGRWHTGTLTGPRPTGS